MNIRKIYALFLPHFRRKRMQHFRAVHEPNGDMQILDIGGSPLNWQFLGVAPPPRVVLLNIYDPPNPEAAPAYINFVRGDGTALQYPDNAFDLAYSNSVIEHVGTWENQVKFASEVRRVSPRVWLQTPARWFFMEPHMVTPFIHFFPKSWQRHLIRNFTVWGLATRPSQSRVDSLLGEIRLLTYKEMKTLFPDCEIYRERFLGMTKSYIAIRKEGNN